MRALASKTLHAQRDNKNRWLIRIEDLEAWSADRPEQDRTGSNTDRTMTDTVSNMSSELAETREQLAAAKAENAGLRDRLADTQAERDRLAGLLDRALEVRSTESGRPGFWSRLLGRDRT